MHDSQKQTLTTQQRIRISKDCCECYPRQSHIKSNLSRIKEAVKGDRHRLVTAVLNIWTSVDSDNRLVRLMRLINTQTEETIIWTNIEQTNTKLKNTIQIFTVSETNQSRS